MPFVHEIIHLKKVNNITSSFNIVIFPWEEERVADLKAKINQIDESKGLKKSVFEAFLKKIYKRSK